MVIYRVLLLGNRPVHCIYYRIVTFYFFNYVYVKSEKSFVLLKNAKSKFNLQ